MIDILFQNHQVSLLWLFVLFYFEVLSVYVFRSQVKLLVRAEN